jgi:hypothetical protein
MKATHKRFAVVLIMMFLPACIANASPPADIERGFQCMYNLEFDQAHQDFSAWERLHPDDPLGPVSQAAGYLFSEFARLGILESQFFTNDKTFEARPKLAPDPRVRDAFNRAVDRGDQLANAVLKQHPEDNNALFATILALGLRSDYAALIDKQDFAALRYMKQSRILAQQLLRQKPDEYDALLAVGVENYLTGIKPAPVRWMLSLGGIDPNKEQGIRELEQTAAHGDLLKPFAKLLLAVAALRDKNNQQGCDLLHQLSIAYPRNALYRNGAPECR